MSKAGNIEISVGDPYPCWCRLTHEEREDVSISLHHTELSDLKYAVEKAMQEAEHKLTKATGWKEWNEVYLK